MCGIGGIYHYGQRKDKWAPLLSAMISELTHRGPDESGYFRASDLSMGVRRLRVIDLETGSQPICNEDGSIVILCNGEIYNYEVIRLGLIQRGHQFKTKSDTEVLLHLYEEYGLEFFNYFDGMFAFALWDSKRHRLIIARDRFGIKPMFYTEMIRNGLFAFSSELRPLLMMPGLSKEIDPVAIDQYFALSYIPHPRSVYRQIKKLSPGSFLLVKEDSVTEASYWNLPDDESRCGRASASLDLDDAIAAAVKKMMRSDVPCGAFLSGGLDSSTLVYHMAQNSLKPIHTFSVRFNESSFDEGKEALLVARHLGTDHHEVWVEPKDVPIALRYLANFGEPFADPALIPTFVLSKKARQRVTVVLSGDGGDEILGGYLTYVASLMTRLFSYFPLSTIAVVKEIVDRMPASMKRASLDYKLKKFFSACRLPPLEHHSAWKLIFRSDQRLNLFNDGFNAQIADSIRRPVFERWSHYFANKKLSRLTQYQYMDIMTFLADNNLPRVDRMSMANSLEVRLPFLDLNVVENAFKLDPLDRVKNLTTKVVLRKIMKERLPNEIIRMKKKGFAVPLSYWFKGPLRSFVSETLSSENIKDTGVLCPGEVSVIVNKHLTGAENMHRAVWSLICFVVWYKDAMEKNLI